MRKSGGAQCQMNWPQLIRWCEITLPVAAMGIMVRERQFYQELARLGVKPIHRHYPNLHWTEAWHAGEAAWTLWNETATFHDLLEGGWVLGNNEEIHAGMEASFPAADRFMSDFIGEVHGRWGGAVHAIVLNAACGNFRDDILNFPRTLAALDHCGKCLLGLHEYEWPDMWRLYMQGLQEKNDGLWLCLKWKRVMAAIRGAGYKNVRCAITECGLDSGAAHIRPSKGWEKLSPNRGEAEKLFWRSMAWYMDAVERDDDVAFLLWYGAGMNSDWMGAGFEMPLSLAYKIRDFRLYPEARR